MTAEQQQFIESIAVLILQYAPLYDIRVASPIIAQAILESGWGKSSLAAKYHNYFGLKCGSGWSGRSVNLRTGEEYTPGTYTTISANFRVYDSMAEGVKGYFDFLFEGHRYDNLKDVTDPATYLKNIKADGYATSSTYVDNLLNIVRAYNLMQYDKQKPPERPKIGPQTVLNIMRGWLGLSRAKGTHKPIIDLYNNHTPLALGYKVKYSDSYCDVTVSAAFIKAGRTDLIGGTECGVERHIALFKKAGIWIEDGTIAPVPGDIIVYNWDDTTQPNDGFADHIGFVESVDNGTITTLEGNMSGGVVGRWHAKVGDGRIRGYARPKYDAVASDPEPAPAPMPAHEKTSTTGVPSKQEMWVGMVTASALNVRVWAGTEHRKCSFGPLKRGTRISVCDTVKASDGSTWYYIRHNGLYGFVCGEYVTQG